MGRPVHWTRNRRYVRCFRGTFATNKQCLDNQVIKKFFLISVANYNFDKSKQCIGAMTIEIDFLQKKSTDSNPYDSDKMAAEFIQHFNSQGFSVGQQVRIASQKLNKENVVENDV